MFFIVPYFVGKISWRDRTMKNLTCRCLVKGCGFNSIDTEQGKTDTIIHFRINHDKLFYMLFKIEGEYIICKEHKKAWKNDLRNYPLIFDHIALKHNEALKLVMKIK